MKKLLSVLSLVLLGLTLTACNEEETPEVPGQTETPEVPAVSKEEYVTIINDILLEEMDYSILYDDLAGYTEDDSLDSPEQAYLINNYMIPTVVDGVATGFVEAGLTTAEPKETATTVCSIIELSIDAYLLNIYYENEILTEEEYLEQLGLLSVNLEIEIMKLLKEETVVIVFYVINNLDDRLETSFDSITDANDMVDALTSELLEMLKEETLVKLFDLTKTDLTNLIYVYNLVVVNGLSLSATVETIFADLLAGDLTEEEINDALVSISVAFDETYGSITPAEFTELLTILNDFNTYFTEEEMLETADIAYLAVICSQATQSINAMLEEISSEENSFVIYNLVLIAIVAIEDVESLTQDEMNEAMLVSVVLACKALDAGIDNEDTLTSQNIVSLLSMLNLGLDEDDFAAVFGLVQTVATVDFESDELTPAQEEAIIELMGLFENL